MKIFFALAATACLSTAFPLTVKAVDYKNDVFPIFKEKCVKCHMEGKDKGSVRLDMDFIAKEIGFTVMPDKPVEASPIYDVVTTKDRDLHMPPPGKGTALTSREQNIVKDWIESGAGIDGAMVADAGGGGAAEERLPASGLPPRPTGPEPLVGQWINKEGKKITATLLSVTGDKVLFKLADGREVPYPIGNLSDESQAIARKFAEEAARE